jgi:hypothetical protein
MEGGVWKTASGKDQMAARKVRLTITTKIGLLRKAKYAV